MKHLKNFEDKNNRVFNYNIGDYVELIYNYTNQPLQFLKAKIIDFDKHDNIPYFGILSNGERLWFSDLGVRSSYFFSVCIIRRLNDNEIEQFELELNVKKYNL